MQVNWVMGETTLLRGMENFPSKTYEAIAEKILEFMVKMVDYAKSNAPWNDRTGAARAGIDADVSTTNKDVIEASLFHTVDYGIFLEVRWGGELAIIIPTIETLGPQMMAELGGIMGDITYYA